MRNQKLESSLALILVRIGAGEDIYRRMVKPPGTENPLVISPQQRSELLGYSLPRLKDSCLS
jgi:hypothetical protein